MLIYNGEPITADFIEDATTAYPDSDIDTAVMLFLNDKTRAFLNSSKGLGDTIVKITHATGLDKLAEAYTRITGNPCGCASRQEALNKLFPYGVKENE